MNNTEHIERVNGSAPSLPRPKQSKAERLAAEAAARAERARILDEARRDRERRAEEWAAERDELREARRRSRKTRNAYARSERIAAWQSRAQQWWHAFVMVGAIVGVNIVAVAGQVSAFQAEPFGWPAAGAFGAAAVIESIAIYVGYHAHVALIEGDSVFRLRAASYGIAAGVGALNYHHYAPDWSLNDLAVMFGAASLLSPWLWAIHSRHVHRKALRAKGLIDPRAPKFAALRWMLHRAETWQALRWAVRYGEQSPSTAILAIQTDETTDEARRMLVGTRDELVSAQAALIRAQADALEVARLCAANDEEHTEAPPSVVRMALPVYSLPEIPQAVEVSDEKNTESTIEETASDTDSVDEEHADDPSEESSDGVSDAGRDRPDEQDNRTAEKWIRDRMRAGRVPTLSEVAERYKFSRNWARSRVQTARDQMKAKGFIFRPGNVVVAPAESSSAKDTDSDAPESAEVSA